METTRSPRKVFLAAHRLARRVLPEHSTRFSRHDFTLAQLFACLTLRTFYGLSYRGAEQLLRDSPQWLAAIGMATVPDHNTLWRASGLLIRLGYVNRMLDLQIRRSKRQRLLCLRYSPLALDSTCFERHHRSTHYERRCRQMSEVSDPAKDGNRSRNPGSWGTVVNASRRRNAQSIPKLSLAVASACHLILAAKVRLGNASDAPDFAELLYRAKARAPVKCVVADAGYDSEANHRIAREEMKVRSIIPNGIGRPTKKLPSGRWRRHMAKRFKRKADQDQYRQRSQAETVHSMIKRNMGSALRARTPERREQEMMMRVLVHNIALLAELDDED